eukprot:1413295-Pyramimonas_sp.AAC.2
MAALTTQGAAAVGAAYETSLASARNHAKAAPGPASSKTAFFQQRSSNRATMRQTRDGKVSNLLGA